MTKSVKYIGTTSRWPELAVTGKQSTWEPGKIEERSDTEAAQLLGTGLFADQSALQLPDSKVAAISAVVSEAGIGPLAISAPDGTERGDTLTATPTAGWTVATYQWTRDGADIVGATSSTYTLTLADEGALIGCVAGSPVFTARLEIPAGTYPSGYLSLNGGVLSLGSGVLSLV